ncbi:MAG: hypothetical protein ACJA2S_003844 [Cyclobacteriaceae bacterium]|jgi:hypothetical protein
MLLKKIRVAFKLLVDQASQLISTRRQTEAYRRSKTHPNIRIKKRPSK